VSPYLYLIYSSTTEASEEVNKIESLPIRSEPQIAQKPSYSSTTEFQLETRLSEESSHIESLQVHSELQIAAKRRGAQMSSVGSPKLSTLCHITLLFLHSLYRV